MCAPVFCFLGKRNVIIDIEFLRMDKYDEYKAIEDTLARIVELKALRDQATDPVEPGKGIVRRFCRKVPAKFPVNIRK